MMPAPVCPLRRSTALGTDPKTILFLNRVPLLGGAERVLLRSMECVAGWGLTPLLACPPNGPLPDKARAKGFEVIPCAFNRMRQTRNPFSLLSYALSLRREGRRVESICRQRNVRLLHPHSPVSAAYGVRAARRLGLPMLVHAHDALPLNRHYALTLRFIQGANPRFVAVSEAVREVLIGGHIPPERVDLIYNALDPAFLRQPPPPADEVTGPGPHIGTFAMILPLKGQHVFLEAAEILAGRFPTARFYVVGAVAFSDYQPYFDALRERANSPALRGRVAFPGFRSDVPRWIAGMDAVALASVEPEALPTVAIEAMAFGKPVAAARSGGTAEIIEDGVTGRLVPPGDGPALADALTDLLTRPPGDPLPCRAAESVRARFAPQLFDDALRRAYTRMLNGGVSL